MESWDIRSIDEPCETITPTVLATRDGARAISIELQPGQQLGDHQVRERAWLTVIEGHATFHSAGETIEAGVGTLVTFEPAERHAVATESGARLLLVLAPWPADGHYVADEIPHPPGP